MRALAKSSARDWPLGLLRHKAALAVFLCAKSQFFIMSDWVGSRKTGRFVAPVGQPI